MPSFTDAYNKPHLKCIKNKCTVALTTTLQHKTEKINITMHKIVVGVSTTNGARQQTSHDDDIMYKISYE